mmetsp:Transcript_15765/g.35490  ORF Transcript_15765/g.35490 Transcript_15765/m.35490 type:complete len:202 (+) Transcript_15765:489-1094(+)
MGLLGEAGEALRGVLCAHIKHAEAALQRGDRHLVHLDVLAVELDVGYAVGHVRLVAHGVSSQVEQLYVPVVVARSDAAVLVAKGVSKCDRPAVPCELPLPRLQRQHRLLHARVPQPNASVPPARNDLRRSIPHVQPSASVYCIYYRRMCLLGVNRFVRVLQVVYDELAGVVSSGQEALLDGRGTESAALHSIRSLRLNKYI